MLTFSKSVTLKGAVPWMYLGSSNHRYDHIQCYVNEPNRVLEYSLTYCSATRQESFLLFTTYNVASEYSSNGQCQLTLGSFVTVSPAFSVSQPATFNSTEFMSTATDDFYNYLGFSTCSGGGENVTATGIAAPTASDPSPLTPVTSGQNQNSTNSISTHSSGSYDRKAYDKKVKVANGVAIPVALLGLVLLGFLVYRRRKPKKTLKDEDATSPKEGTPHEDTQPYLQQKAELEAEEKRKHELEARERTHEMGNEGERYELPVEEEDLMVRTRQELRGGEHSTELEVPR